MPSLSHLRNLPESERIAAIRDIVDDVCRRVENRLVDESEARDLAANVRFQCSWLIPDRMELFDRIYGARFERLIRQFIRGES